MAAGLKLHAAIFGLKDHSFKTMNKFWTALYNTNEPHLLSTITKLVDCHRLDHLKAIRKSSLHLVQQWILNKVILAVHAKGRYLARELYLEPDVKLMSLLEQWSLEHTLAKAQKVAPTLLDLLCSAETHDNQGEIHRDHDLVSALFSLKGLLADLLDRFSQCQYACTVIQ